MASHLVIAIDGPSGAGKSTVARGVARRLGLRYLDTGATYRAVAWRVLSDGLDPADQVAVATLAGRLQIVSGTDPAAPSISVDGVRVDAEIRTPLISKAVSPVAATPAVRRVLVAYQQSVIGDGGIVVEGRDIGTVVAPDAPVKVFLTASASARASRRSLELPGSAVSDVRQDLDRRDQHDSGRADSPLLRAEDAVVVDATALSPDEVVDRVVALVPSLR